MELDQEKLQAMSHATPLPQQVMPAHSLVDDDDDDVINIGEIFATLMEYKWFIMAITAFAVAAGIFFALSATPVYRADALLQVEEKSKGLSGLSELQPLLEDSTSVSAELEILNSRMILGRVVERLQLDIIAEPLYFPVIGRALARRHAGDELADPLLGLASYAWGGERIRVETLNLPEGQLGGSFVLVAGDAGAYQVLDEDDQELFAGRVGELASGQGVSLFVSAIDARVGSRFRLARIPLQNAISTLRSQLAVQERTKKSGVLEASIQGPQRDFLPVVLDEVLNTYVRQNVEYRSAEAESTLRFLESQLPIIKSQVDAAELAYNNYRQNRGSVDLTIETQSVLRSIVEVDNETVKLQQQREELRQNYTPQHPRIMALDAQIERLRARRGVFERDVAQLPDTQQTALRLKRDLEVSTVLYTSLLNTAQKLRVSKAGTVGDVRIIDSAVVASLPVEPRTRIILALSGLLGVFIALALIWLRRTLRVVVEDPEKIERALGLSVYATVPHSKAEVALVRKLKAGKVSGATLLALTDPEDDAIESLRSLRTTLHFALLDAARGSILISGASPAVGKSFIARNLGAVLAQSGKTVVLVDADLRKGHLHREFGFPREGGVSEYVSGGAGLAAIVRPSAVSGLSVVTTGQRPPNPSELLMHPRFADLLARLGETFDIIIVDAPPILAVSDAAIIGRHVGATLIVARAGVHPIRELEQTVKRFTQAGVPVKGFVFNDLDTNRQRYRYGYGGYVYRYSYK